MQHGKLSRPYEALRDKPRGMVTCIEPSPSPAIADVPKKEPKALIKHEQREEYLGHVIKAFNEVMRDS